MNRVEDDNKATVHTDASQRAVEDSGPRVNVARRNLVKASLASGPLIMTVVARPAGAISGASMNPSQPA
jgi:hypothetical protein